MKPVESLFAFLKTLFNKFNLRCGFKPKILYGEKQFHKFVGGSSLRLNLELLNLPRVGGSFCEAIDGEPLEKWE